MAYVVELATFPVLVDAIMAAWEIAREHVNTIVTKLVTLHVAKHVQKFVVMVVRTHVLALALVPVLVQQKATVRLAKENA